MALFLLFIGWLTLAGWMGWKGLLALQHGYGTGQGGLVFTIAVGWMAKRLWQQPFFPEMPGSLLLGAMAGTMHLWGARFHHFTLMHWSLPVYLAAAVAARWGRAGLRAAWPGLVLTWLSVPLSIEAAIRWLGPITYPERWLVAGVVQGMLRLGGVVAFQEGTTVTMLGDFGSFRLNVVMECSGYGFLSALFSVVLIYMMFVPDRDRRFHLLLFLPLVSVSANVLRVLVNAAVAAWWGPWQGYAFSHHYAGYVMLIVSALALLMADGVRLSRSGNFFTSKKVFNPSKKPLAIRP